MLNTWFGALTGLICWLSLYFALIRVDNFKGKQGFTMRSEFDCDRCHNLIDELEINERSRDDLDHTLLPLKCLCMDKEAMALITALIGRVYRRIAATDNGRLGMNSWSILVLTVLKHS